MAGRKTKVTVDVGLQFQDAGNSLQKILNNLRTGLTKGEFSNIFGKSFEADLKKYQDALTKVSTFKLTPENTLQYQQAIQELEQSWIRFSKNIETSVASQKLIDPKAIEDAKAKLADLEKQLVTATGGLSSKDVNAKTGLPKKDPNDTSSYTQEVAKVQALRQAIAQQHREITNLEKAQAKQTAVAQQAAVADKALANSREQHEHVVEGLAEAHRKLAEDEGLANRQDTINNIKAKIQQYTSFAFTIQFLRSQWNQLKQTYQEVDKQLTSIAMVSGKSQDSLWAEIGTYNKLAQELGKSTTEVLEASKLFYQQGLSTNEVLTLTTESLKLAAIAETDAKTATDYLTTAINGFKLEASQASMVTDTWAELAGRTAVDVEDLAVGISKVASIAQSAGMELQSTSAFLTQIIETTREAPETAGTALKTIIARFQELKTAPGALEDGVDANKVEAALKTAGVALRDTAGQFRDFDEVILELSSKWDGLDRNTQRYIATIAAGSRQQSRFIALVDDYDSLVENMSYANDSAGASMQQFTAYSNGLEASIQRSKTAWEGFYLSLNNGNNIVSFAFNTLTSIFNVMSAMGPGVTLILGGFAAGFTKLGISLLTSQLSFKEWLKTFKLYAAVIQSNNLALQLTAILRDLNNGSLAKEAALTELVTVGKINETNATYLLTKAEAGQKITTLELVAAQLGLNLAMLPYIAAVAAVVAIIGLLVFAIHRANTAEERRIEQLKEEAAAAQEVAQQEQELLKTYEDLADRLDKVATGEENLEEIRNALIAQFGPYLDFMDENKKSVNLLTASYEELVEAMAKLKEEQAGKAAAANYVAAKETFEASEAERINQIRESDKYQETKARARETFDNDTSLQVEGYSFQGHFYESEEDANAARTKFLAENEGIEGDTVAIIDWTGYRTSDGEIFTNAEAAATHEADLAHDAYEKVQTNITSESDARAIAQTYDIGGFDERDAEEQAAIIEALQQGLIDFRQEEQEINGEKVTVTFLAEGQDDFIESVVNVQDAFDSLENGEEVKNAFNQLLDGDIKWEELDSGIRDALTAVANDNDFVAQLISNWETDFEARKDRIAGMLEAAGLQQGVATGTYYTTGWEQNAGTAVLNALGTDDGANLDLKEAFLAQFNALAEDPEAQAAYAEAMQRIIDDANGDFSLLTPGMFETLASDSSEVLGQAYSALLDQNGQLAEGMNSAYYDELRNKLGEVAAGYYEITTAANSYLSAMDGLAKAQEGMSLNEMSQYITQLANDYEKLGYDTREAAMAALWANVVSEDGTNFKLQESDALNRVKEAYGEVTVASVNEAIQDTETSIQTLKNKKALLQSILDYITIQEDEAVVGENIAEDAIEQQEAIDESILTTDEDLVDIVNKYNITGLAGLGVTKDAADQSFKTILDDLKSDTSLEGKTALETLRLDLNKAMDAIDKDVAEQEGYLASLYETRARLMAANKKKDSGSGGKSDYEREREAYEKRKEILESEGDAQEKRIKLIQEELKMRKEALKEEQEALKDAFEQQKKDMEGLLDYLEDHYKKQQELREEAAEKAQEALDKEAQALQDAIDSEKRLIQAKIDAMDEEAEAEDRLLKLQKARDEYERARTSKTRLVLTKGAGWIFKTDNAQVADAAANLKEAERDYEKSLLEEEISRLDSILEGVDKLVDQGGKDAEQIALEEAMRDAWIAAIKNGTINEEVLKQFGSYGINEDTGAEVYTYGEKVQAAINANTVAAEGRKETDTIIEGLNQVRDEISKSLEEYNLTAEEIAAAEKILIDGQNTVEEQVRNGATAAELAAALLGSYPEDQALRASQIQSLEDQMTAIDESIEAYDEILDMIGKSTSELEAIRKQVEKYTNAATTDLLKDGIIYNEEYATVKKLAEAWEELNLWNSQIEAKEKAANDEPEWTDIPSSVQSTIEAAIQARQQASAATPLTDAQVEQLMRRGAQLGQQLSTIGIEAELDQHRSQLERFASILRSEAMTQTVQAGGTYNFGTVNIESDANSIEQLVTDIRRLSPLTNNR